LQPYFKIKHNILPYLSGHKTHAFFLIHRSKNLVVVL